MNVHLRWSRIGLRCLVYTKLRVSQLFQRRHTSNNVDLDPIHLHLAQLVELIELGSVRSLHNLNMASIFKAGHTAVITGGASGIGLSLAKKCFNNGMKVLVADWDEETLNAAPKNVGGDIGTIKVDVSKTDDWAAIKSRVDKDLDGQVNLLALNAAIGPTSSWDSPDAFRQVVDVNLLGVINGISTLLPSVKSTASSGSPSAVVITGSKQGITNPPGNPAYNASKSAVKTIAEHLSFDLRDEKNLSVHLLVPGWTFTGLSGNRPGAGKEKPDGAWWPDQVVDFLDKKMAEGQFWVLCPDDQVTEGLVSGHHSTRTGKRFWGVRFVPT